MKKPTFFLKILSLVALISAFAFTVKKDNPNFSSRKIAFNKGWNFLLNDM